MAAAPFFQIRGLVMHPAQIPSDQLLVDCEIKRTRASGPGGQHRNKVETAIVITHRPTGIVGQASERRSQEANREVAVFRLRTKLAIHVRTGWEGVPSDLWTSRKTGGERGKLLVNPRHQDFPALLAEALDCIVALEFEMPPAAEQLGVSTTQLLKFLKLAPDAFAFCNSKREKLGLRKLK